MSQAKITSVEVLESFRASLVVFLTRSRQSTDEIIDAVRRTGHWVQNDQRLHWEGQLRRARKWLERAEAELLTASRSEFQKDLREQKSAVRKAKEAVEAAENKLRKVKVWTRDFERMAQPLIMRMESLRSVLNEDMPKAIWHLAQAEKTLDAYMETRPGGDDPAVPPST